MINDIYIVSPSGAVDPEYVAGAKAVLEQWGYKVYVTPNACGKKGRFSASDDERISDLQSAINAPGNGVILCSRGGYGLSRIIDKIDFSPLKKAESYKLIVGFSDITAIHNAVSNLGLRSLHAPMTKNIATEPQSSAVLALKSALEGRPLSYSCGYTPFNRGGSAKGRLVGGNLSIIYALRGTKYDLNYNGAILFIEDIGERLYHIDRMIQNLRLGGVFERIAGLVVGQFTDCDEDDSFTGGAYGIISEAVKDYDFPVAMNFSAGHIGESNMPLLLGANYRFNVSELPQIVTLDQTAD
ncbi:MAG: LD-carboxypeptidase [Paludibacteraceae bacterium]|nr:LD-carboxypeptidase [Paludibacteraceae bacterium]